MNKTLSRGLMACLSLVALASCQDYDGGFDEGQIKKAAYAKHFEDTFGKIDPNQDWSMAQQVTANVSGVEDGIMEIYYSDPIGGQPVMITQQKISGGKATLNFDVVKGTKNIFARINDGTGYYSMKNHFQIVDGKVNICPALTRAVPTGVSRAKKRSGDPVTLVSPQVLDPEKRDRYEVKPMPSGDFGDDWYIDGAYAHTEGSNVTYLKNTPAYYTNGSFENVYYLYDVLSEDDERPEWYVKDIAHYFISVDGEPAVFDEGTNHVKLMKPGSTPHLQKDLVFTMESAGPFYLDYFAKGTAYNNQFGYFYFTGANPTVEQFMKMPKFVLVDNMSTRTGNITVNATTTKPWDLIQLKSPIAGAGLGNSDMISYTEAATQDCSWDSKIIGTRLQLTYFGENGTDATGSYTFPKDTKIGLFIIGNSDMNRDNEFITSIAQLNLDMYNEYPHAASFQYNDQVVFAMEDQRLEGDADVNDVMFIANGTFKKTDIPQIKPVTPTFQTWIVACEDLGGTFDYDFNDVVFGLRKEDKAEGQSDLYLVPLAAGGTLKAEIIYNDDNKGEIHHLVNGTEDFTTPLNVGAGSNPGAGTAILLGQVDKSKSINDCAKMINIKVTKDEAVSDNDKTYNVGYSYGEGSTAAPQAIILPAGWDWPSEMTHIWDVYEGITSWVADGDVTTWCNTKKSGASIVHNPLPAVPTPSEPSEGEGGESGGSQTPTVDPTNPEWNISVSGYASMQKDATQTLTVTIDGVSDYSVLSFGTYSTSVITAAAGSAANEFVITGNALGTALFWVKMPADDTHKLTRKEYEITVTYPDPEFTLSVNGSVVGASYSASLTDQLSVTCTVTKGLDYFMYDFASSDPEVAEIATNGTITIHKAGTTTISKTHKGGNAGPSSWNEKTVSFNLIVSETSGGGNSGGGNSGGGGDVFVEYSTKQYTQTKDGFGEAEYAIPSNMFEGDKAVVEYVITGGPQFSCAMGNKGRVTESGSFEITGDNMTTAKETGVPFTIHYYGQTSCSVSFTITNYKKE